MNDEPTDDEVSEAKGMLNEVINILTAAGVAAAKEGDEKNLSVEETSELAHNFILLKFMAVVLAGLLQLKPEGRDGFKKHLAECIMEAPDESTEIMLNAMFKDGLWGECKRRGKYLVDQMDQNPEALERAIDAMNGQADEIRLPGEKPENDSWPDNDRALTDLKERLGE